MGEQQDRWLFNGSSGRNSGSNLWMRDGTNQDSPYTRSDTKHLSDPSHKLSSMALPPKYWTIQNPIFLYLSALITHRTPPECRYHSQASTLLKSHAACIPPSKRSLFKLRELQKTGKRVSVLGTRSTIHYARTDLHITALDLQKSAEFRPNAWQTLLPGSSRNPRSLILLSSLADFYSLGPSSYLWISAGPNLP